MDWWLACSRHLKYLPEWLKKSKITTYLIATVVSSFLVFWNLNLTLPLQQIKIMIVVWGPGENISNMAHDSSQGQNTKDRRWYFATYLRTTPLGALEKEFQLKAKSQVHTLSWCAGCCKLPTFYQLIDMILLLTHIYLLYLYIFDILTPWFDLIGISKKRAVKV